MQAEWPALLKPSANFSLDSGCRIFERYIVRTDCRERKNLTLFLHNCGLPVLGHSYYIPKGEEYDYANQLLTVRHIHLLEEKKEIML